MKTLKKWFENKQSPPLRGRINWANFLKLSKERQAEIYRSCINKSKLDSMKDVAAGLLRLYKDTGKIFNFYGCNVCGGFHLTSGGKGRKKAIKRIISKILTTQRK